jgi:CyaY protein
MPPTAPEHDATAADAMTDAEYASATRAVLASIEATVDGWLQADVIDIDSQRTGGLLELSFPAGSKIIINTQPPLQELWLAARAGGFHFRRVGGHWRDTRSGGEFFEVLSNQASAQGARPLVFKPPASR